MLSTAIAANSECYCTIAQKLILDSSSSETATIQLLWLTIYQIIANTTPTFPITNCDGFPCLLVSGLLTIVRTAQTNVTVASRADKKMAKVFQLLSVKKFSMVKSTAKSNNHCQISLNLHINNAKFQHHEPELNIFASVYITFCYPAWHYLCARWIHNIDA